MPRLARLDAPGALHHVMGRGIEGRPIFPGENDCQDFIFRLADLVGTGAVSIYAWALLPNHFHLLCKTRNETLAWSMRRLLTGYAVNFNKRYKRQGHLFQNRYKSIICQEDAYLLELVRYIHLNPLRAEVVQSINDLNFFPYSGHSAVLGKIKRPWQDTNYVLDFFGKGYSSQKNYLKFVEMGLEQGNRHELVGGGPVRSLGGWSEVLSLRRRGETKVGDQRILGDSHFVQEVVSESNALTQKALRFKGRKFELSELVSRVILRHDISLEELQSGSVRRAAVESRRVVAWLAVKVFGYSGAEVARYLGVTCSCINRALGKGEMPRKEEYS
jgi:REP-associated tyrosine transposase